MECRKLTEEELAQWEVMGEIDYADSPLHDEMLEEAYDLIVDVCYQAAVGGFDWVCCLAVEDSVAFARHEDNLAFRRLLKRAYEHAVACGHAGSCCNLANMYHDTKNQGSSQDYAIAIDLYELGASRGDTQSSINLGYIFYYGRGVAVDYSRAYECFAHGALVGDNPEGYWKLGDLYASGKGVRQSDRTAYVLYSKAHKLAGDSAFACRAAHHMADYLLSGIEDSLEPNPDAALRLYNEAELGYYALIDSGLDYYGKQLEQCIEGQARARQAAQEKHYRIRAGEPAYPQLMAD